MSAQILDDRGPLDEARLKQAEAALGVTLPAGYRAFLLQHNGGRPEPRLFDIRWSPQQAAMAAAGREGLMAWFFGVHEGPASNLEKMNLVTYEGRLPAGTLAIGRDGVSNLLLLRTTGPRAGEVLFWLAEAEADTEEGEVPDEANVAPVAEDFDAFLRGLR